MQFTAESLDDVLIDLYKAILEVGDDNNGTRGDTKELLGVSLKVEKPRARISRSENRGKPFSALGELLWYLSGSDQLEFIQPYVSRYRKDAEDGVIHGAYGPRFFRMRGEFDQFANVEKLLRERAGSRRAVIQLFNAEDIAKAYKEIPCTTTLQFLLRSGELHLSVTLRSNDAYWGLPHDFFCFTMIQEMMARRLGVEVGAYHQYVGSMHIYNEYLADAEKYIEEGHQKATEMPPMSLGNPFELLPRLLEIEGEIRQGDAVDASDVGLDVYWSDIVRLLQVFWAKTPDEITAIGNGMSSASYASYIAGRASIKRRALERAREKGAGAQK